MCWACVWWQKRAISYHLLILVQHINATEVDPQSHSLHNGMVKPKNSKYINIIL